MCGSTSVACCPGATVYGSELICARFGAFEDDVKRDDGPEEQATKANIRATIGSYGPAPGRFVSSLLREIIGIGGRMDSSSMACRRKAMEFNGPECLRRPSDFIRLEQTWWPPRRNGPFSSPAFGQEQPPAQTSRGARPSKRCADSETPPTPARRGSSSSKTLRLARRRNRGGRRSRSALWDKAGR